MKNEIPKHKKAWVQPREAGLSQPKRNIHCNAMLNIWWDMNGAVLYCELSKPSETITGELYWRQLICLKRVVQKY